MQANRNILSFTSSDTYFRPYKIVFQQFIADNLLGEFLVIDWGKLSKFCMAVWDYFINTKIHNFCKFTKSPDFENVQKIHFKLRGQTEIVCVDLTRIISCCFFSQKMSVQNISMDTF